MNVLNFVKRIFFSTSAFIVFSQAHAQRDITLHIGDDAPQLKVGKWIKGEPIAEFKPGQVYVLDFWATWCVPCREGMPHMTELAKKYKGKATVMAMSVSEPPRPDRDIFTLVDGFVRKMGDKMNVHVAMDTDDGLVNKTWMKAAGLGSLPSVIIVDQKGKIAWIGQSRSVDSVLAVVVAGNYDGKALANRRSQSNPRQENDEAFWAVYLPIQKAIAAKDYIQAIALYDRAINSNAAYAARLKNLHFQVVAHVNPDIAYQQVMAVKGTEKEYELARILGEEEDLQKRFYDFVIDYYTHRSENDFFAMGHVAKAHFNSGNVSQAIKIQKQFVEDLKLPTTPSTVGYIKREEDVLKKYESTTLANPIK